MALVYVALTALFVIGTLAGGPEKLVERPGSVPTDQAIQSRCAAQNRPTQYTSAAECISAERSAGNLKIIAVPDWGTRLGISGAAIITASFFVAVVLGLATLVAQGVLQQKKLPGADDEPQRS